MRKGKIQQLRKAENENINLSNMRCMRTVNRAQTLACRTVIDLDENEFSRAIKTIRNMRCKSDDLAEKYRSI
ncbi:hypothetical protein [Anaeroarcus burkinensis]|uniref:hypothetical protein n=1 Tax=Anaeroarcus burkinensis TaxID=82376 RepID=UPI000481132E|nr:hypothetical protein [Anaeroarcus burkinensis]